MAGTILAPGKRTVTATLRVMRLKDDPAEPASKHAILLAGSAVVNNSAYFLYYDYSWHTGGIGVATGTVTRE